MNSARPPQAALLAALFAAFLGALPGCGGAHANDAPDLRGSRAVRDLPPFGQEQQEEPLLLRERALGVMGTNLEIQVLGEDAANLERALDAAIAELRRVEDLMTDWRASPLTALNEAAGKGPREVPPELARLIARALDLGELTDGAFDVTYAAVGRLWDFKRKPPLIPAEEDIKAALENVGYERVKVDLDASTVDLPEGMRLGLGGIAKGYGVDRAMRVLMDHEIRHALVNAGGDLKALGKKRGEVWRIAVPDPRDRDKVMALLPLSNTCVMTSGDYERFFEHEGQRFHHIIDPRDGYPSRGCMSATIVAQDAAYGDALATAMCVLGIERGLEIVEALPRVEALLVGMDGRVHASKGLAGDPAGR